MGLIKWNTRSLDHGSCDKTGPLQACNFWGLWGLGFRVEGLGLQRGTWLPA